MVDRLFQIVYTLMNQKSATCNELAKKLECSPRTIMRDLDKLSMAGIPIYTSQGKGGGIHLLPDFILDKSTLTNAERDQILSSLQALSETSLRKNDTAFLKLSSLFGTTTNDWLEIDFSKWGTPGKEEAYFEQIKESILSHRMINISYAKTDEGLKLRKVKPRKLCYRGYAWYLYAYCMERKDYRFFKLGRIESLVQTDEFFQPEEVGRVLKKDMFVPQNKVKIQIQVQKEAVYRALEELPKGIFKEDGSMITEFEVEDNTAVVGYLLSLGSLVKVLKPEWLRVKINEEIENIKKMYEV